VRHYQVTNDHNSVQLCSDVEQVAATITPQMLWYTLHRTWQHIRLCYRTIHIQIHFTA